MALMKDIMQSWHDTFSVRRVFGDPIEKDGVTIIPVAMVAGGGGGGSGSTGGGPGDTTGEEQAAEKGSGGGFGGMARPTGVYVVTAESVEWKPALDVTLIALAGIALAGLITRIVARIIRRWH